MDSKASKRAYPGILELVQKARDAMATHMEELADRERAKLERRVLKKLWGT